MNENACHCAEISKPDCHITEKGIQYLHALTQEYFMMTEAIQHVLLYNEESEDLNNVDAERDETLH